jgi:ketosteroid isomerase-like protein
VLVRVVDDHGGRTLLTAGGEAASRTPQEVFQHHAEALVAGDMDGIVSDYSDDAVFVIS